MLEIYKMGDCGIVAQATIKIKRKRPLKVEGWDATNEILAKKRLIKQLNDIKNQIDDEIRIIDHD